MCVYVTNNTIKYTVCFQRRPRGVHGVWLEGLNVGRRRDVVVVGIVHGSLLEWTWRFALQVAIAEELFRDAQRRAILIALVRAADLQ